MIVLACQCSAQAGTPSAPVPVGGGGEAVFVPTAVPYNPGFFVLAQQPMMGFSTRAVCLEGKKREEVTWREVSLLVNQSDRLKGGPEASALPP